jgi:RNA polymerase sigma-70 factor (ECF subfamily)
LGEDEAFRDLYDRCYRLIRDYCRRRVPTHAVDDAVAETFLTAWRRRADLPAGDDALVWLYRVAYRVVGHQWRSADRRRRLVNRLQAVGPAASSTAEEPTIDASERRLVLAAAERLHATDAEVLRLAAWEQLPIADIAAVLQITPNAVKQRLHRARRNLASEYRRLESRPLPTPDAPKGGTW